MEYGGIGERLVGGLGGDDYSNYDGQQSACNRDASYLRYHQAWTIVSVAVVTFVFDGRVNVWQHDRLFMANWTWQYLWMACATFAAVLPQSLGDFAGRVGIYTLCGIG